jgi:TPR repeat protein
VTRHIDADELAAMLRRAKDFIKASDLSSARLLLQRAVEAGSMQAALTLAGTFDPNVLAGEGFQGGAADIAMARLWYERAEQLGSSEAPRRLRQLASNSR